MIPTRRRRNRRPPEAAARRYRTAGLAARQCRAYYRKRCRCLRRSRGRIVPTPWRSLKRPKGQWVFRTTMKSGCVALAIGVLMPLRAAAAAADQPPRFEVPAGATGAPLTFVIYGDTRFTKRAEVANAGARRALVAKIASEHPAAILIGGDLVFTGTNEDDYATYTDETQL